MDSLTAEPHIQAASEDNSVGTFVPREPFVLVDDRRQLVASGVRTLLPQVTALNASAAVSTFFSESRAGSGPGVVVGGLPFNQHASVHLYQPSEIDWNAKQLNSAAEMPEAGKAASPPAPAVENAPAGDRWTVVAEPSRGDYARQVELALSAIAGTEGLEKVVLARRLALHSTTPIDVQAVVARLRTDGSVTTFCVPLPPATDSGSPNEAARGAGGGVLVGATPELLVERSGRQVISHPLAGSARRNQEEPDEDDAAGRRLLQSAKDLREHALVVEMVADLLAPYCRTLNVPDVPSLASTRTMWHLGTQVRGELRSNDVSSAELAVLLHPTPAVCGMSKPLAYELIHKLEPFDRGFYAGAVGWCDDRGDGRWMVALRCAELYEGDALLYAGAGIVAGSDPLAEAAETAAKFSAMLAALGAWDEQHMLEEETR